MDQKQGIIASFKTDYAGVRRIYLKNFLFIDVIVVVSIVVLLLFLKPFIEANGGNIFTGVLYISILFQAVLIFVFLLSYLVHYHERIEVTNNALYIIRRGGILRGTDEITFEDIKGVRSSDEVSMKKNGVGTIELLAENWGFSRLSSGLKTDVVSDLLYVLSNFPLAGGRFISVNGLAMGDFNKLREIIIQKAGLKPN